MRKYIYEIVVTERVEGKPKQSWKGFFKWQFGVLKKCLNQKKNKRYRVKFFPKLAPADRPNNQALKMACRARFWDRGFGDQMLSILEYAHHLSIFCWTCCWKKFLKSGGLPAGRQKYFKNEKFSLKNWKNAFFDPGRSTLTPSGLGRSWTSFWSAMRFYS